MMDFHWGFPTEWRAELFGGLSRWVFDREILGKT